MLKALAKEDKRLRFVSHPDEGEVYAVNEGISMMTGTIYGIQASDDYYVGDAVETAVNFLEKNKRFAGVAGDALFIDQDGRHLERGTITYRGRMSCDTRRTILRNRIGSPIVHGGFFGWKHVKDTVGPFDPAYAVTADYEYYMRLLAKGYELASIARVFLYYTIHADMGAVKFRNKVIFQNRIIRQNHGISGLDEIYLATIGRVKGYYRNDYRQPLIKKLLTLMRTRGALLRQV
jgi:hypothetical protein